MEPYQVSQVAESMYMFIYVYIYTFYTYTDTYVARSSEFVLGTSINREMFGAFLSCLELS